MKPKEVKYAKMHRGSLRGQARKNCNLVYGNIGLQSIKPFWLSSNQIEASLKTINKAIKRYGKCILRVFPNCSRTIRPTESRMGSGKGDVSYWVAKVKKNTIVFELTREVPDAVGKLAFKLALSKLPACLRIINKE